MALLRHYQFSPDKSNINSIANVLIKAQMQLPNHDFTQLLQLIPERLQVSLTEVNDILQEPWKACPLLQKLCKQSIIVSRAATRSHPFSQRQVYMNAADAL